MKPILILPLLLIGCVQYDDGVTRFAAVGLNADRVELPGKLLIDKANMGDSFNKMMNVANAGIAASTTLGLSKHHVDIEKSKDAVTQSANTNNAKVDALNILEKGKVERLSITEGTKRLLHVP